jgi:NO-binding membrane sensor protein with MHYT domain
MLKVLSCVANEHDLRLVAISAMICALGCFTTTALIARAREGGRRYARRWLACAAVVFGCSVWSLHFVAMLAFMPGTQMSYDVGLTAVSILVSSSGALAAFLAWRAPVARSARICLGGTLLGVAISGMHYVGVAAMSFSGFLIFDRMFVAASVVISVVFSTFALARAGDLRTMRRRLEVTGWLSLAICGLHFTGMTAITLAPGAMDAAEGVLLGTATLAIVVGSVSLAILMASLAATMVEQHLSQLALQDLGRMRLLSNLAQEVLFIYRNGAVV